MAGQFLSMLLRRGPKAFERFIEVLMSCEEQQFIAERLDPEMAERYRGADAEAGGNFDNLDASRRTGSQRNKSDDEIIQMLTGYISRFCFCWHSGCKILQIVADIGTSHIYTVADAMHSRLSKFVVESDKFCVLFLYGG